MLCTILQTTGERELPPQTSAVSRLFAHASRLGAALQSGSKKFGSLGASKNVVRLLRGILSPLVQNSLIELFFDLGQVMAGSPVTSCVVSRSPFEFIAILFFCLRVRGDRATETLLE